MARLLLSMGGFLLFASLPMHAEWTIHKADGRDYVPIESIANFYNFPGNIPPVSELTPVRNDMPNTRRIELSGERNSIVATTNSREIILNGVKHWLAFPTVVKDDQLLISRLDLSKTIEPALRPTMVKKLEPVKTVVLDAGHGGHDKGALSVHGMEKNFALDVARRAKRLLEKEGFKVLMTRENDTFIPLEQRPKMANRLDNAIFVSIHFNSSLSNRLANGFEIFSMTPRGAPSTNDSGLKAQHLRNEAGNERDDQSAVLANVVYHSLLGQVPQMDRGVKRARFAVLRLSKVPAILVECGFLSNVNEAKLAGKAAWRNEVASAIVEGIQSYNTLATTSVAPKFAADYQREKPSGVTLRNEPTVVTNALQEGAPTTN